MTLSRLRSSLALSVLLTPAAMAQNAIGIRVEGSVVSIIGTVGGPLSGAAVGDAAVLEFEVGAPGAPIGSTGTTYDVLPSTVSFDVASASDGIAPGAAPTADLVASFAAALFRADVQLAGGLTANLVLAEFAPIVTFASPDLAQLFGTYALTDFDSTNFFVGGVQGAIDVQIDRVVIGPGDSVLGTNYCGPAAANSLGLSAAISATGTDVAADNDIALRASSLPFNAFGIFLVSDSQSFVTMPGGSQGNLCLGGEVGRYVGPGQIKSSGTSGAIDLAIDLTQIPRPTGPVVGSAGQTWNFQAWYRDAVGGSATSNFTDGLSIMLQ
ncbi:MAG: hypothetical protein AAF726_03030 [Planctomycetota bacterium]